MPSKSSSSSSDPLTAGAATEPPWSHRYSSEYESISSFEEVPPWKPKPSKWAEVNQVDSIFARLILATTKREEKKKEKEYDGNLRFQGMTTEEIIDSLMDSEEFRPRSFENPHGAFPEPCEDACSESESEVETCDEAPEKEDDGWQHVRFRFSKQVNSLDESLAARVTGDKWKGSGKDFRRRYSEGGPRRSE